MYTSKLSSTGSVQRTFSEVPLSQHFGFQHEQRSFLWFHLLIEYYHGHRVRDRCLLSSFLFDIFFFSEE